MESQCKNYIIGLLYNIIELQDGINYPCYVVQNNKLDHNIYMAWLSNLASMSYACDMNKNLVLRIALQTHAIRKSLLFVQN